MFFFFITASLTRTIQILDSPQQKWKNLANRRYVRGLIMSIQVDELSILLLDYRYWVWPLVSTLFLGF